MASYVQMSIRSISTKKVYNLRLTSNESLEGVNLAREEYEFSYIDGMGYHFMNRIHTKTSPCLRKSWNPSRII